MQNIVFYLSLAGVPGILFMMWKTSFIDTRILHEEDFPAYPVLSENVPDVSPQMDVDQSTPDQRM